MQDKKNEALKEMTKADQGELKNQLQSDKGVFQANKEGKRGVYFPPFDMEIIDWIDGMVDDLETIKSHVEKGDYKKAQEYTHGIASDAEYLCDLIENKNED